MHICIKITLEIVDNVNKISCMQHLILIDIAEEWMNYFLIYSICLSHVFIKFFDVVIIQYVFLIRY